MDRREKINKVIAARAAGNAELPPNPSRLSDDDLDALVATLGGDDDKPLAEAKPEAEAKPKKKKKTTTDVDREEQGGETREG
jgi:hypothetical protein